MLIIGCITLAVSFAIEKESDGAKNHHELVQVPGVQPALRSAPPELWHAEPLPRLPVALAPSAADGAAGEGADVAALVCSFAWPCNEALAVFGCESGLRSVDNGAGSFGIGQIQAYWHRDKVARVLGVAAVSVDEAGQALLDAAVNLQVSAMLWADSGWWHWRFSMSCWGAKF